ncbi:sigma-70 family RNA polymerase sigma factor [Paracoccus laeviglucosivorans]|uniref:RNA polymerase sigma-70 factor, ECF subfamily n=1 Tax=Paracoccus laeviglucosivorans TaxID=1197861 RepID=A0A521D2C0_9RHOB|nr:sigma-70 family RNA polymerase sigma factor [Paracoccus laeviglucosivorans]SMO65834.1 RNA polymerase sigma-70 factor, ECF subfamily [Paracoccus laeviglucosivorans]
MSDNILDHIPALRAYSRALCRHRISDAEDLVQETLMLGIERVHQYRPGTNKRAWLFTIMRNRFFTNCHKAGRERTGDMDCVSAQRIAQPEQEWHLQIIELRHALQQLPTHYREAIVLIGVLGESYDDAARIMDCDIGTVKSRVSRARSKLQEVLNPAGDLFHVSGQISPEAMRTAA